MNSKLRDTIQITTEAIEKYEFEYYGELIEQGRQSDLKSLFLGELKAFVYVLCTLDDSQIGDDRVELMSFHFGERETLNYYRARFFLSDDHMTVPEFIKGVICVENLVQNRETAILNSIITVLDYLAHDFITCGCVSMEDLAEDEVEFACDYLENIRTYAREHYFDASLIKDSDIYQTNRDVERQAPLDSIAIFSKTLAAGYESSVGVKSDGTVIAVGSDEFGECDVFDWKEIVSVAIGEAHTVGIKRNGRCVATGCNSDGECDVSTWEDVLVVEVGSDFTVGLKSDGTVIAAGKDKERIMNAFGKERLVCLSASANHIVGLRSDGSAFAYGDNSYGQCDIENWTDIVEVSAGTMHTLGLKKDGTVIAAGLKRNNRCEVWSWEDIVAISAGGCHSAGLRRDGTVISAGMTREERREIAGWKDIVAISAGDEYLLGLRRNGMVVVCGEDISGECEASEWGDIKLPAEMGRIRR